MGKQIRWDEQGVPIRKTETSISAVLKLPVCVLKRKRICSATMFKRESFLSGNHAHLPRMWLSKWWSSPTKMALLVPELLLETQGSDPVWLFTGGSIGTVVSILPYAKRSIGKTLHFGNDIKKENSMKAKNIISESFSSSKCHYKSSTENEI